MLNMDVTTYLKPFQPQSIWRNVTEMLEVEPPMIQATTFNSMTCLWLYWVEGVAVGFVGTLPDGGYVWGMVADDTCQIRGECHPLDDGRRLVEIEVSQRKL